MDGIAAVTPWVTGVSESAGGSGDPSPVTAFGVHARDAGRGAGAVGRPVPARPPRRDPGRGQGGCGAGARCSWRTVRGSRWPTSTTARVDALGARASASTPIAVDDARHGPSATCSRRARSAASSTCRVVDALPVRDRLRWSQQPARVGRRGRRARGARDRLRARTSSPTRAGSSTSPRSSPATTATVRFAATARIEATHDRACSPKPRSCGRRTGPGRRTGSRASGSSARRCPADAGSPATRPPGPTGSRSTRLRPGPLTATPR